MSGSIIEGHEGCMIGSVTGNDNSGFYASEEEAEANAKLISAAPELLNELKSLYRAYVRLLEAGHDRILSLGGDCDPVDKMESEDQNLRSAQAAIAKATA